MRPIIEARNLTFSYRQAHRKDPPLIKNLDLQIYPGELVAIQGPSGSGKSTLLYLLGGFLKPQQGDVLVREKNIYKMHGERQAFFRNQQLGFVFQQFHLLPKANVIDNILLPKKYPAELIKTDQSNYKERALELATQLGLQNHTHHKPSQLSGGQQQRVAIARALMNSPEVILADEPTGNLDSRTAGEILTLLREIVNRGKTVVVITHDKDVADQCDRVIHFKDGVIDEIVDNRKESAKVPEPPPMPELERGNFFSTLRHLLPVALSNLLSSKMRSSLTMIGIVVGIASVLAMMSVGQFTGQEILKGYQTLGVNKVDMRGYRNWQLKATDEITTPFTEFSWENDILPMMNYFSEVQRVSPTLVNWNGGELQFAGKTISERTFTVGVSEHYLEILGLDLIMGRNFSTFQIQNKSRVCILGYNIAKKLFSQVRPLGQLLHISGDQVTPHSCRVVGVLENRTSNEAWLKPNDMVILPYTFFKSVNPFYYSRLNQVTLQLAPGSNVEAFTKAAKRYFVNKYGISGTFRVSSDSILVSQIKQFLGLFKILLAAIASISLLVGGVGITNMMLASISEQLREIGIRKAHGATNASIRLQYLLESLCLCLIAGFIGLVLGFGSSQLIIYLAAQFVNKIEFAWVVNYQAIWISIGATILVGLLSGLIPALRAERLQVIDALRSD